MKRSVKRFPIVGIGASAGGLAAFEAFFSGLGDNLAPGMAFVLVQHLSPDHPSLLAEILRRSTGLPVFEVKDGMKVQPNCVYVIPPKADLGLRKGALRLLEPTAPRGHRLPIDFFFRALAEDHSDQAIGVVLSGTGSDGTLGIRAIKGKGGMVVAQSPQSAEFDAMPVNAIATGLVDYQLEPACMLAQILAYITSAKATVRPPVSHQEPANDPLGEIFALLKVCTGHDFSGYKSTAVARRIGRRLAVHQIDTLSAYAQYMRENPAEVQALFRDLLIGVTHFFRDREAFLALEHQVIPALFAGKPAGATVRVWSVGCSTGEEAYSLAILLYEYLQTSKLGYTAQVFASDIDPVAVATARKGVYPANIVADVSASRLEHFFVPEAPAGGYRVHQRIRDMVVIAEQDVLRDPPFSRIDLLVCRNLLIYLGAELQKKIIPLFHFSLNPGGSMFLGSSEGVGEFTDLFAVTDGRAKLYKRNDNVRSPLGRFLATRMTAQSRPRVGVLSTGDRSLRELTEQSLLKTLAPVAALVNGQGEILYLHGRTGLFLEPAPGVASVNNILKMAREGLRSELTVALHQAVKSGATVRRRGLSVNSNGHFFLTNLAVHPLEELTESGLYLVTLEQAMEEITAPPHLLESRSKAEDTPRLAALIHELRTKEDYLQSARQELESFHEEMNSSTEEMQSMYEELQSANEEMQTSKEELQSVNEELATVNAELHEKVEDLSRTNNDLTNLLSGTGIATVFVDLQLNILRYTADATSFINLIPGDLGRPMSHILSNLVGYESLVDDAQSVLNTLMSLEREVRTANGKWYTLRIQPYRTLDNTIEGVVLTFVDITEMVRIRESLRLANTHLRLALAFKNARDAVTVQDLEGHCLAWNPAAVRLYGWTEAEALAMQASERIPKALREDEQARLRHLSESEILSPYRSQRLTKSGESLEVSITSTALLDEQGQIYAISTIERGTPRE